MNKFVFPFVVFLTGACVLILEVVATRVLSPYYGNTIFTVSSVLGVVLAALSAGYYVGGKIADKYPSEKVFYKIITASGFSVVFLHFLQVFLLPKIGYNPSSIVVAPLVSSIILFFLPSFLLGTLSPFAIKLHTLRVPEKGIGTVSGEIFFWSTLGSIFGSLSAGFILIPRFGISQIISAISAALVFLGLVPLIESGISKKSSVKTIFLIVAGISLVQTASFASDSSVVYSADGVYEKILIRDGTYKGRPVRLLEQDRTNSSAMYLDSDDLVYEYSKYLDFYKIFQSDINNALVIGGGAYTLPKALLKEQPNAIIDVAEIEPSLFDLGKKYFRVPDDPRLRPFVVDGRRLLKDSKKNYDLIFSDVYYSLYSVPAHFTTEEFFRIAYDKLSDGGVFMANLIGDLSPEAPSFIFSEIRTFKSVFPNSYFFAVRSPDSLDAQNIIVIGVKSDKFFDVPAKNMIDTSKVDLSSYSKFTDDFSPVEYFTAPVLRRAYSKK